MMAAYTLNHLLFYGFTLSPLEQPNKQDDLCEDDGGHDSSSSETTGSSSEEDDSQDRLEST